MRWAIQPTDDKLSKGIRVVTVPGDDFSITVVEAAVLEVRLDLDGPNSGTRLEASVNRADDAGSGLDATLKGFACVGYGSL